MFFIRQKNSSFDLSFTKLSCLSILPQTLVFIHPSSKSSFIHWSSKSTFIHPSSKSTLHQSPISIYPSLKSWCWFIFLKSPIGLYVTKVCCLSIFHQSPIDLPIIKISVWSASRQVRVGLPVNYSPILIYISRKVLHCFILHQSNDLVCRSASRNIRQGSFYVHLVIRNLHRDYIHITSLKAEQQ